MRKKREIEETKEEEEGGRGTHIKGAKILMAKLNSQMKTLLGVAQVLRLYLTP